MSAFSDAVMQSMISSMDPQVAMQRDAMAGYLELQRTNVQLEKAKTLGHINELLATAIANKADESVIATYRKLAGSLSE